MGKRTHGPALLQAIERNDQKKVHEILMLEIRSKKKIQEILTTSLRRPAANSTACPLLVAASLDDPTLVKYFVSKHNVNVNFVVQEHNGRRIKLTTVLKVAVRYGLHAMTEVLLAMNADPNILDHKGCAPLHYAIRLADYRLAKMLISRGAQTNLSDETDNTPLHLATKYGHNELVKLMVQFGGDLYKKGPYGAIPIHMAAKEGHLALVKLFTYQDVNINTKVPCYDGKEKSPLHVAAEEGHVETTLAMVEQFGADVNITDSEGETPLHATVIREYDQYGMKSKDDYTETAKVLVKHGANVNAQNLRGETPLHLAARNEFQKVVEVLVQAGANAGIKDNDGNTAMALVSENDTVTKQLLKEAMEQLERKLSDALEIEARGFSTSIQGQGRTKSHSTMSILSDGTVGRSSSTSGLFMVNGSSSTLNAAQGDVYENGYLQPLGSRNNLTDQTENPNPNGTPAGMYETIDEKLDQNRSLRKRRLSSEIRRSREQMLEGDSDSTQGEEKPPPPAFKGRLSGAMDLETAQQPRPMNTFTNNLPDHPTSMPVMRKVLPELNQAVKGRAANLDMSRDSGNTGTFSSPRTSISTPYSNSAPDTSTSPGSANASFAQRNTHVPAPVNTTVQHQSRGVYPVNQPVVNKHLLHVQQQTAMNGAVSESDDTFFDDSSFDTMSEDFLEDNRAPGPVIQHIQEPPPQVKSEMVPMRVANPRGDPRLMETWLAEQARIVHDNDETNASAVLNQTNLQKLQADMETESITTMSQSEAGDFDRRFTITLQPSQGGEQQVTINTAELAKAIGRPKEKPKPAPKPRKSKSSTPPPVAPAVPSRLTKPYMSFQGIPGKRRVVPNPSNQMNDLNAPGERTRKLSEGARPAFENESENDMNTTGNQSAGSLQWEGLPADDEGSMYWEHTSTEQIYEAIKDQPHDHSQAQPGEEMYMEMQNSSSPEHQVPTENHIQNSNKQNPQDSNNNAVQEQGNPGAVRSMQPPPSPRSLERRNSRSKPVAIPTVPGMEGQGNKRTSLMSVNSVESRASVSSINTVIYVPNESEKQVSPASPIAQNTPSYAPHQQIPQQQQAVPASPAQPRQLIHTPNAPVVDVQQQSNETPAVNSVYEELPGSPKKQVSIGSEEVFQESQALAPNVRQIEYDTKNKMRIAIVGGNVDGIFVHRVDPGSDAEIKGVREGDQILRVNNRSMKGKTREEAQLLLMSLHGKITLLVEQKKDMYDRTVRGGGSGDAFYVRAMFDYEGEREGELTFSKGDIMAIRDTFPEGRMGSWRATKFFTSSNEEPSGYIPNKERAEQYLLTNQMKKKVPEKERGGIFRRSMRRAKSAERLEKEKRASAEIVKPEGPLYEIVDQRYPGILRPVVLLGLFSDAVRNKLAQECGSNYELPPPEAEVQVNELVADVEKRRVLEAQLSAIRRVVSRRKHCLLILGPQGVDQLTKWELHPIVIFLAAENKNVVKNLKAKLAPDFDQKAATLFEQSAMFERQNSHLFTATVPYTMGESWFTLLKDTIGRIQNQPVWVKLSQDELDGEDDVGVVSVKKVTTTTSTGQQRTVNYVQLQPRGSESDPGQQPTSGEDENQVVIHDHPDANDPNASDLGLVRPRHTQNIQAHNQQQPHMQYQGQYIPNNVPQNTGTQDRQHQQVNILSYMDSPNQPRSILKHRSPMEGNQGGPSPVPSTDSSVISVQQQMQGQYQQQQQYQSHGHYQQQQYQMHQQHVYNGQVPPRMMGPQYGGHNPRMPYQHQAPMRQAPPQQMVQGQQMAPYAQVRFQRGPQSGQVRQPAQQQVQYASVRKPSSGKETNL